MVYVVVSAGFIEAYGAFVKQIRAILGVDVKIDDSSNIVNRNVSVFLTDYLCDNIKRRFPGLRFVLLIGGALKVRRFSGVLIVKASDGKNEAVVDYIQMMVARERAAYDFDDIPADF